jgi:Ca2+-binding RTX toxin-like protein
MAGYVFESMSDKDAAAFGDNDILLFRTASANQVNVQPYSNGSSGSLSSSGITLSFGGISHTFGSSISNASLAGNIVFNDSSHLVIGTQAGSAVAGAPAGTAADATFTPTGNTNSAGAFVDPNVVYALGGGDTINFTTGAAGVSNYLNGGFGADTITGGNGNNHIYGNSQFSVAGDTDPGSKAIDGGDTITAGNGTNYINGNAGADTITVGTNAAAAPAGGGAATAASTGFNRVFGGADADTITVQGGGHNTVNGNTGNDTINDTGIGDNTLRGGQGDDIIRGGSGHSVLMGDVGNDVIFVHGRNGETVPDANAAGGGTTTGVQQHIDVITGGAGSDTFDFTGTQTATAAGGMAATNAGAGQAALFGQQVYYQEITDFLIGTDKIHLLNNPTATGNVGHSATIFTSVQDAEVYAQSQLSGNGNQGTTPLVESLAVGSANNTYLFYLETGNTAVTTSEVAGLGIIHLDNVTAANVSYTDFNTSASVGG